MRYRELPAGCRKGVVAIGGDAVSARTQVVMGVRCVEGRRHRGVPGQVWTVFTFIRRCDHVRLVVVVSSESGRVAAWNKNGGGGIAIMLSGIAVAPERMRPAETHAVFRRQFLGQEQP